MNATMKKNFVIAGNTIEEVEADLRALKSMVASGMTSGCGGQTAQAALEAQSAMCQVHGWAPDGMMMEAADPKPVSSAPTIEDLMVAVAGLLPAMECLSGKVNGLSTNVALGIAQGVTISASEEDPWEDEDDWEDMVADTVHEEIDDLVEVIQNVASEYEDRQEMARILVNCATELLRTALRDATAEESRGEALQNLINIMDELVENLDACE